MAPYQVLCWLVGWETIQINNTSTVQFNGTDTVTTEQMQVNAGGVLSLQDGDASDDLTIQGGFLGGGSLFSIDAVLAGDGSASDVLRIAGDTSGNTTVNINNLGGAGDVTTAPGILVIDVNGTSNGTFSLATPININGYEYNLVKVGNDFYLQGQAVDADLSIDKTLQSTGPFYQDDEVVYEITVTNNGPVDANNVVVTDTMTNLSMLSVTGGNCVPASFPCTINNLANGASATLTVTASIDGAGAFDNSASVTADEPDNNTGNNTDNTGNGGNALGRYQIGVTVTGLANANEVTLQNNGTDDLVVDSNNTLFNFSTTIKDGEDYDVSISSQPTAPN